MARIDPSRGGGMERGLAEPKQIQENIKTSILVQQPKKSTQTHHTPRILYRKLTILYREPLTPIHTRRKTISPPMYQ